MPNSSGLSKLTFKLKTLDNQILHRNFMHFEVNSNKKLKNVEVFSLPPKCIKFLCKILLSKVLSLKVNLERPLEFGIDNLRGDIDFCIHG